MDGKIGDLVYKYCQQDKRLCLLEEGVRKANLVIRGISEQTVDNIRKRVLDWLNSIGMDKMMTVEDLISVFRIGLRRNKGKKRNVLVKFASINDKLKVMSKIREDGDKILQIEGDKIEVYQDISREEHMWRHTLKPITKLLRNKGIKYNWRFPQQFNFFYNRRMHTIDTKIDPVDYLHKLGLIEKEDDVISMKTELLQMGGYGMRKELNLDEERGAAGGEGPELKVKPQRKRKPTKERLDFQKKSRENGGENVGEESEMEDQLGSGPDLSDGSECGKEVIE